MEDDEISVKRKSFRVCYFPQRYVVTILTFFGIFVMYLMNVSVNTTFKHVLVPLPETKKDYSCELNETYSRFVPTAVEQYNWTSQVRSLLNTAYFWGPLFGSIPGGVLADRYGARHVINCSILGSIFFHILTPKVLQKTHGNYVSAMVVIALNGFTCSMLFPSFNSILSHWAPKRDLGKQSAITFAGTQFAVAFYFAVSETLINLTSWSTIFYINGALAAVWFPIWYFFGYSRHAQSPFVTFSEYKNLRKELEDRVTPGRHPIPWRQIFKSVPLWALIVANFGHFFVWHAMFKGLPNYMQQVLRFSISDSYLFSALPYAVTGCLTIATGFLSDFLINNQYFTTTRARKVFSTATAVGNGVVMVAATYVGCARVLTVLIFAVGMGLSSGYYTGTRVNSLDLAPNFSGVIMGIINSFGVVAAFISSPIVTAITKNEQLHEWQIVFWMFLAVLLATNTVFLIFGDGEVQAWNFVESRHSNAPRGGNIAKT